MEKKRAFLKIKLIYLKKSNDKMSKIDGFRSLNCHFFIIL